MGLLVDYPPSTPEQRALARRAAHAVFAAAELDPMKSFTALFALEAWDLRGFDEAFALTDEQEAALEVLGLAEIAACEALGLHGQEAACLQLEFDPEEVRAPVHARSSPGAAQMA